MPLKPLDSTDLAYIAGLFDGEGHIGFGAIRSGLFIRVLVVNTDRKILEYLQECFGGDIHALTRKDGWKQAWQWRLCWSRAIEFVTLIQPWLRIKKPQANIALCWDYHRPGTGGWRNGNDNREVNEYLRECITYLNKRGEHDLEDPIKRECDMALVMAKEAGDQEVITLLEGGEDAFN